MLYFFHHYELPVIIQQAQLQQLLIRNRNITNLTQQQRASTNNNQVQTLFSFLRRRVNNDTNNNMNEFLRNATGGMRLSHLNQNTLANYNLFSRLSSILRGQVRVTMNVAQETPIEANTRGVVNVSDNATIQNNNDVLDENNTDTRSNFQRNYEENNFLFPPDLLMGDRDRPSSQTVENNNQAQALSEQSTLYSVTPILEPPLGNASHIADNNSNQSSITTSTTSHNETIIGRQSLQNSDQMSNETTPKNSTSPVVNSSNENNSKGQTSKAHVNNVDDKHDEGGGSSQG